MPKTEEPWNRRTKKLSNQETEESRYQGTKELKKTK